MCSSDLQLLHAQDLDTTLERYVTFDFETTDNDAATCGVVEIGAARVVKRGKWRRAQSSRRHSQVAAKARTASKAATAENPEVLFRGDFERAFAECDVLVTPTSPCTARTCSPGRLP